MVSSFYANRFPAGQEVKPREQPVPNGGENHFSVEKSRVGLEIV